ncbi:hypothetical protein FBU30_006201 [Linnemannia zychae]|nr:hypothetical protein FBU30_006201 [Linnemannia zychae]
MKFLVVGSLSVGICTTVLVVDGQVFEIPLIRNPSYRANFHAQMEKVRYRYGTSEVYTSRKEGYIPVKSISFDAEYFGPVTFGSPGQVFNMNFDTGSADTWIPSTFCESKPCLIHRRFSPSKSTTFKNSTKMYEITYGDGSFSRGFTGSDMVNVGGIKLRQTFGLATNESIDFAISPMDGMFGLAFSNIQSTEGVKTFMDNAIMEKAVAKPVVSAYLPSLRRKGGKGGHYLFGAIDSTKFSGALTYVPVTMKGNWQVHIQDVLVDDYSFNRSCQGIIDTGTTLIMLDYSTARSVNELIEGATYDTEEEAWTLPCSTAKNETSTVGFKMGGREFKIPLADMAWGPVKKGSMMCYSGVQGIMDVGIWVLGDVFIKNNYCVFDQSETPSVGIAPLK